MICRGRIRSKHQSEPLGHHNEVFQIACLESDRFSEHPKILNSDCHSSKGHSNLIDQHFRESHFCAAVIWRRFYSRFKIPRCPSFIPSRSYLSDTHESRISMGSCPTRCSCPISILVNQPRNIVFQRKVSAIHWTSVSNIKSIFCEEPFKI